MKALNHLSYKIHVSQSAGLWVWHIVSTHSHTLTVVRSARQGFGSKAEATADAQSALETLGLVSQNSE